MLLSPAGFDRWAALDDFRRYVGGIFADRLGRPHVAGRGGGVPAARPAPGGRLARPGEVLHATHQQLADELGTVREMVTRLLKRFERSGWMALSRERIPWSTPARCAAVRRRCNPGHRDFGAAATLHGVGSVADQARRLA